MHTDKSMADILLNENFSFVAIYLLLRLLGGCCILDWIIISKQREIIYLMKFVFCCVDRYLVCQLVVSVLEKSRRTRKGIAVLEGEAHCFNRTAKASFIEEMVIEWWLEFDEGQSHQTVRQVCFREIHKSCMECKLLSRRRPSCLSPAGLGLDSFPSFCLSS